MYSPYKNLIIGGNFDTNPWQRGTAFSLVSNGFYPADRWRISTSGAGGMDVVQSPSGPTVAQAGTLVTNCMSISVNGADTSIGATDLYGIAQRIEGYNFRRIAQREFTLSFWMRATVTGTYCVAFSSSNNDRSYVAEYTVVSSNVWQYVSVTVPASPVAGTWDYTNGLGIQIRFTLAAGSNFQGTAGSWQSANIWATSNQVNAMATNANIFQLSLVQVEAGPHATQFENRTAAEELELAQRYYCKSFPLATTPAQNAGLTGATACISPVGGSFTMNGNVKFPVEMRATPSITTYNPSAGNSSWRRTNNTPGDVGVQLYQMETRGVDISNNAATNAQSDHYIHWTAESEL